ncbi:MAG: hypothetical protein ACLQVI_25835 [Polyangiaceae bacterium]
MLFPLFVAPVAVTDATSVQTDTSASTPLDPTTGRPIPPRDESGQPLVPTDATGQPIILRDESGQPLPTPPDTAGTPTQPDSLLVNRGGGVEFDPAMAALRVRGEGTVYRLHVELVEGYNSNVVQTGLAPAVPHPALFTGLDVGLELLTATSPTDMQVIRFVVRGQQYVPLDGYHELDDGTVTASFARTFTLSPRTFVTSTVFGTLTSSNSALISDGPVLVPDPSELTRVYTEDLARIGFVHELGPRWRLVGGADVTVQAPISEAPFQEPNGTLIYHSGLDDIVPGADLTLTHDLDPYNIGMLMARYEFTDVPFVANYTTDPPTAAGSSTTNSVLARAGWAHAFTDRLRTTLWAGATIADPPALDPVRSEVVSPTGDLLVTYVRSYWNVIAEAVYSYGSLDPRLGFGPGETAKLIVQGIPYPHGSWNNLAVLANGIADNAEYIQGAASNGQPLYAQLTYVAASVEARYGLNNWLGLIAGYSVHESVFGGAGAYPPLLRSIAFAGVSGYFADDHSLPLLTTFTSPTTPM